MELDTKVLELAQQISRMRLEKSTTLTVGDPTTSGLMFNNYAESARQIWSMCTGEIISDVVRGGSLLMRWIPGVPVNTWVNTVSHLSWVAGKDFNGAESYMEYLEDGSVGDCGFGPGGMDFQVCEYTESLHPMSVSNESQPLSLFHAGGMKYCEQQPVIRLRGSQIGTDDAVIDNDADWIVSLLAADLEMHMDWDLINGDASIAKKKGLTNGLDTVISEGYVALHHTGEGSCDFTDPLVFSGAGITTARQLLNMIKWAARKVFRRMRVRGQTPNGQDMAIALPWPFWDLIADEIALGSLTPGTQSYIEFTTTPEVWQRERDRVTSGGMGFGSITIDGITIPVLPEELLGNNTVLDGDVPSHTGDVYILTRRFAGRDILRQEYMNWNRVGAAAPEALSRNSTVMQNGMIRTTWVTVNDLCYFYGLKLYKRLVSLFQPLQVKITDVTLEMPMDNYFEAGTYTHDNFYPYDGASGGAGVALISGIN